jgi:hypothetical protein
MSILEQFIHGIHNLIIPSNKSLEIELRYNTDDRILNSDFFKFLIKSISDESSTIEQSINFIKKSNIKSKEEIQNSIKQVLFIDGEQQKEKTHHYHKEKLITPLIVKTTDEISFKISAAFEVIDSVFDFNEVNMARIRLRFCIIKKNWRIDIGLIRTHKMTGFNELKSVKSSILFPISVENFIETAPWKLITSFELEAEYIGKKEKISIDDFLYIDNILQPTFKEWLEQNYKEEPELKHGINHNSHIKIDSNFARQIYTIATLLMSHKDAERIKFKPSIKSIGNQPIELDKNIYLSNLKSNITNYYITDKVDGKRTIIFIHNNNTWAISDDIVKLSTVISGTYIFDCEYYKLDQEDKYFIFDIMYFNKSLIREPFDERLKLFPQAIKLLPDYLVEKPFILLTSDYADTIKKLKLEKKAYDTDGFILTPIKGKYFDMEVYKYKPANRKTIDFLVKKCPQKLLGIEPYIYHIKKGGANKAKATKSKKATEEIKSSDYTVYLLFTGINENVYHNLKCTKIRYYDEIFPVTNKNYFPYQFEPSIKPLSYIYFRKNDDISLDGKICEFIYNIKKEEWELVKIREDRQKDADNMIVIGNNFRIAEKVFTSYIDPLVIELDDSKSYFQVHDNPIYKQVRNYNSFIKAAIFEQFKDCSRVIDMASGKGQDLFRYSKYNMGTDGILFLEIDKIAIMELVNRKHEFAAMHDINPMKIFIHNSDLNEKYTKNIKNIKECNYSMGINGVDIIFCNLAFHYFVESKESIKNVIAFINNYLKPKGRFVFSSFDGNAIFDLLKSTEEYKSNKEGKFHIRKLYKEDYLLNYGQHIEAILPFSNGEFYKEPLVNIDYIEEIFKQYNISLERKICYTEYINDYGNHKELDEDDKTFIGLYYYYIFYKK